MYNYLLTAAFFALIVAASCSASFLFSEVKAWFARRNSCTLDSRFWKFSNSLCAFASFIKLDFFLAFASTVAAAFSRYALVAISALHARKHIRVRVTGLE